MCCNLCVHTGEREESTQRERAKGGIQKTKTGKIASKKYKGGGQRCQKDTTVPTKSDFNAISTKNSRGCCIFSTQFFPS